MSANDPLVHAVLDACIRSAPQPLYPSEFVQHTGVSRAHLDGVLDQLRLGGLLTLTDWVPGKGQGYLPTQEAMSAVYGPTVALPQPVRASPEVQHPRSAWEDGERARAVFLDPQPPVATFGLLGLNVVVYVLSQMSRWYYAMGALTTDLFLEQEWWRTLTYQFLHGNTMHIFFNMFFLYQAGPMIENMWGWWRFLVIYLYAGVCGGCLAMIYEIGDGTPLVGASGALYGILTSLGVWVFFQRQHLGDELTRRLLRAVGINLVLMVVISVVPNTRISWAGHFGGAIGGAAMSVPMFFATSRTEWKRYLAWFSVPFLVCFPIWAVFASYGQVG